MQEVTGKYYTVASDILRAPLQDYLMHGYETRLDFRAAVRRLIDLWKGRTGECIDERNGFRLLRFHDTPGGMPDEEWLPGYLLDPSEVPEYMVPEPVDEIERELDEAFGFED